MSDDDMSDRACRKSRTSRGGVWGGFLLLLLTNHHTSGSFEQPRVLSVVQITSPTPLSPGQSQDVGRAVSVWRL